MAHSAFVKLVALVALAAVTVQAQLPITRKYVYASGASACTDAPYYMSLRYDGPACTPDACGLAGPNNETRANVDCLHKRTPAFEPGWGTYVMTTSGYETDQCVGEGPFVGAVIATNECVLIEKDGGFGFPLFARASCIGGVPTVNLCNGDPECRACFTIRGSQCQTFEPASIGFGTMTCVDGSGCPIRT